MRKGLLMVCIALLTGGVAFAQSAGNNEDGKKIDKDRLEKKDYMPTINGTLRAKYEYQTSMKAGRFEMRNARVSITGNVLPIVAYKAEVDLSDEGQITHTDAFDVGSWPLQWYGADQSESMAQGSELFCQSDTLPCGGMELDVERARYSAGRSMDAFV